MEKFMLNQEKDNKKVFEKKAKNFAKSSLADFLIY